MDRVLVIAHRGGAGLAPENTLAAFRKAVELRADLVELDVHLCMDSEPVVIHDDIVDRVARIYNVLPGTNAAVKRMSLTEIKSLDVGSWFAPEYSNERIPTLREALELLKGKTKVIIEIKRGIGYYPGIVDKVLGNIKAMKLERDVTLVSFDLPTLYAAREKAKDISLGIVFDTATWEYILKTSKILRSTSIFPNKELVTAGWVNKAHTMGLNLYPYTIDEEEDMLSMIRMGVDGIVTNRPDILFKLLIS